MPSFVIDTYTTTPQTLDGFENGIVTADGFIYANSPVTITGDSFEISELTVMGTLLTPVNNSDFAPVVLDGRQFNLTVTQTGNLLGTNSSGALLSASSTVNVFNQGSIIGQSSSGRGLDLETSDAAVILSPFNITNSGTIHGGMIGIDYADVAGFVNIVNSGVISGGTDAIAAGSLASLSTFTLDNSGTVSGNIRGATTSDTINNAGVIQGDIVFYTGSDQLDNTGQVLGNVNFSGTSEVNNTGEIVGNLTLGTGNSYVTNSGAITGDVDFQTVSAVATLRNSGTIEGDVDMGDGVSVFNGIGGTVGGTILGSNSGTIFYFDTEQSRGQGILQTSLTSADSVYAGFSYTLETNIEDLYLTDAAGAANGTGNDLSNFIFGNNSANEIHGLDGDDFLYGYQGADILAGGQGDDRFEGGSGADVLNGGEGSDTAAYTDSQGWVNVSLLTGFVGGGSGSHAIGDSFDSIENITGSKFGDLLNGDHGANSIYGGEGNDNLRGRGGADRLEGAEGSDTADYVDSASFVNVSLLTGFAGGGAGSHAIGDTWIGIENFIGSNFADLLSGDNSDNILEGRAGADTFDGNGGNDTLSYASSASFVNVSLLTGFAGGGNFSHAIGDTWTEMENLLGSVHNDLLNGDNFNNVLTGGAGNDQLRGNNGVDTFVFADGFGNDTVLDFGNGSESFDFSGHSGVDAFSDLTVSTSGANALIEDSFGNSITVTGAAGLIDASDFIF